MPGKKADSDEPTKSAPRAKRARKPKDSEPAVELEIAPEEEAVAEAPGSHDQAVTFRLDDQLYGLPIQSVQEIQQLVDFMPLPDAAPALIGLLDLRGLIVPAVDLRILVGMERREYTLETPMVFCRVHGRIVCLVVDSVEDVVDLPPGCMQAPSNLYALADRMLGVCRLSRGLVLLLDPDRLVPDSALTAADAAGGAL